MRYFTTEWQTAWQFAKNEEERKKWMKRLLEFAENTKNNLIK